MFVQRIWDLNWEGVRVRNLITHDLAASLTVCVPYKAQRGTPKHIMLTVYRFILCTQHGHSTSFTSMGFVYVETKCIIK